MCCRVDPPEEEQSLSGRRAPLALGCMWFFGVVPCAVVLSALLTLVYFYGRDELLYAAVIVAALLMTDITVVSIAHCVRARRYRADRWWERAFDFL